MSAVDYDAHYIGAIEKLGQVDYVGRGPAAKWRKVG